MMWTRKTQGITNSQGKEDLWQYQ